MPNSLYNVIRANRVIAVVRIESFVTIRILRAVGYAVLFSMVAGWSVFLFNHFVIMPLISPDPKARMMSRDIERVLEYAAILLGLAFAVVGLRVGFRKRTGDKPLALSIKDTATGFKNETSVIRVTYFFLFVFPTALLFLGGLGGSRNDHDRVGSAVAIFIFPPMVNVLIMAISLAATPLVCRYSKGWASASHVRNSIVFPIASVLISWIGAAIGG